MIEREKAKDHERVKEKTLGQPVVVKERKGGNMASSTRGKQRQVGTRVRGRKEEGGYRKKPLQRRGSFVFFVLKQSINKTFEREVVECCAQ
jgi:hypothetical protein